MTTEWQPMDGARKQCSQRTRWRDRSFACMTWKNGQMTETCGEGCGRHLSCSGLIVIDDEQRIFLYREGSNYFPKLTRWKTERIKWLINNKLADPLNKLKFAFLKVFCKCNSIGIYIPSVVLLLYSTVNVNTLTFTVWTAQAPLSSLKINIVWSGVRELSKYCSRHEAITHARPSPPIQL